MLQSCFVAKLRKSVDSPSRMGVSKCLFMSVTPVGKGGEKSEMTELVNLLQVSCLSRLKWFIAHQF